MKNKKNFGKLYEDFQVSDVIEHWPGKTITESDNNLFCLLTMNHHPVHLDIHFAKESKHKKILVNGLLVISLVVGLTVREVSGKAIANLGYSNITHHAPTFINDTVYCVSKVISKINKTKNGIVKISTNAYNQKKKLILSLERTILVPKKKYA